MYLFFDTETTGLPKNWKAPVTDLDNWPRLVQLGYIYSDETGRHYEGNFIIKPDGFEIPKESSDVHGITTERAIKEGVDLKEVLLHFEPYIRDCKALVAHNMNFDEKIVGSELLRMEIDSSFELKPKLCTMLASVDYCRIPGNFGYKWPKLQELHNELFDCDFDGAHDAFADIDATEKCFWELRKLGLI